MPGAEDVGGFRGTLGRKGRFMGKLGGCLEGLSKEEEKGWGLRLVGVHVVGEEGTGRW